MTPHGSAEQPPTMNNECWHANGWTLHPHERGECILPQRESPAEQPPAESLHQRVSRAIAEAYTWDDAADAVIPLVTEDVQRRIVARLDSLAEAHRETWPPSMPEGFGYHSAISDVREALRRLDLSSPALEEQP